MSCGYDKSKNILKYKTAVNLVINGGMRIGELAALEWMDIDLKTGAVKITESAQYILVNVCKLLISLLSKVKK